VALDGSGGSGGVGGGVATPFETAARLAQDDLILMDGSELVTLAAGLTLL